MTAIAILLMLIAAGLVLWIIAKSTGPAPEQHPEQLPVPALEDDTVEIVLPSMAKVIRTVQVRVVSVQKRQPTLDPADHGGADEEYAAELQRWSQAEQIESTQRCLWCRRRPTNGYSRECGTCADQSLEDYMRDADAVVQRQLLQLETLAQTPFDLPAAAEVDRMLREVTAA